MKARYFRNSNKKIVSKIIRFKNGSNLNIVAFSDSLKNVQKFKGYIIIPPGYGETKKDYLLLAHYLAVNGFFVLRYDNTFHTGESDGEMLYTDLLKMYNDLEASTNFILKLKKDCIPLGIIATSLSARVALRAAVNLRIDFLISLVGVVNLKKTMDKIYNEDLFKLYRSGNLPNITDVLGFEVENNFLRVALNENFSSLSSTVEEARSLRCPVSLINAEKDQWVNKEDVSKVYKSINSKKKRIYFIKNALHQLQENPLLLRKILKIILDNCNDFIFGKNFKGIYDEPNLSQYIKQKKIETNRLKKLKVLTKASEKEFWANYLSKYKIIIRSKDYREFLKDNYDLLFGEFRNRESILDAGCGNGLFGAFFMQNLSQKILQVKERETIKNCEINYTAIDFVPSVLKDAENLHRECLSNVQSISKVKFLSIFKRKYFLHDLDSALPFKERSFDKIFCNLVLSYLNHPLKTVKNFFNLLKPSGTIIISTLKPYNDLSIIYSNYVQKIHTPNELDDARRLLSAAGKIREKEGEGHYKFFSKEDLTSFARQSGFKEIRTSSSFGNQAYILLARK